MNKDLFINRLNFLAKHYQSITEFASVLGISRQTVGFWLNGDRVPDAKSLAIISKKMGVSVDWLLGLNFFSDERKKNLADILGAVMEIDRFDISEHIGKNDLDEWCEKIRNTISHNVAKIYSDGGIT